MSQNEVFESLIENPSFDNIDQLSSIGKMLYILSSKNMRNFEEKKSQSYKIPNEESEFIKSFFLLITNKTGFLSENNQSFTCNEFHTFADEMIFIWFN